MSTASTRSAKTQQINFRATDRQADVLRRAAAATDSTLTDFVLDSAVERAEKILADRRWFVVSQTQWGEWSFSMRRCRRSRGSRPSRSGRARSLTAHDRAALPSMEAGQTPRCLRL